MPDDIVVDEDNLLGEVNRLEQLASTLEKAYGGVQIENSGTVGSEGDQGGGQAGSKDIGGVDSLMIGKMIDGGSIVPSAGLLGQMCDQEPEKFGKGRMAGYLKGYKNAKDGEDMDSGDGNDEDYMDGYKKGYLMGHGDGMGKSHQDSLQKSVMDTLLEDNDIREGYDASDFMSSLVKGVSDQIDAFKKSMVSDRHVQGRVQQGVVRSLTQLSKSVAALAQVAPLVNELAARLDIVERTPAAPPRGSLNKSQAQAAVKQLPGEAGNADRQLNKSQGASVLSYMNIEKGIREINGRKTGELAGLLESGNIIDAPTIEAINTFLDDNPKEASRALEYH